MAKRRTRFGTWCKRDINDTRKINYTFRMKEGAETVTRTFTSEEDVERPMLYRLRYAWIESIELINNEWYAVLYED